MWNKNTIDYFNQIEENFRLNIRLKQHKNWIVSRVKKRKIICYDGVHYINLTTYKKWDKSKNKWVYFTYYHNEEIKKLGKSLYDLEYKKLAINNYLSGNKTLDFYENYPSRMLIFKWINSNEINKFVKFKKQNYLKNYSKISQNHKFLHVEIDDCFTKIQSKHKSDKLMNRMITFYLYDKKYRKYEAINSVQIWISKQNLNNHFYRKNEYVWELINQVKDNYYDKKLKIILKGDDAKFITKLQKNSEVPVLDKFHLNREIVKVLSIKYFKNNDKKVLKTYLKTHKISNIYSWIFNCFRYKTSEKFIEISNKIIKELVCFLTKAKQKEIINLLNKIKQKQWKIWNKHISLIERNCSAESKVIHYFKKFVKKTFSRYNIKTLKLKILYGLKNDIGLRIII